MIYEFLRKPYNLQTFKNEFPEEWAGILCSAR